MEGNRLFLLDAYALIFRAYYALIKMPRMTRTGFNTSAIFGFVNTLEELLRKERPTHIAVCFDPSGPTFRHEASAQYKSEREATPEDIKLSVPVIKEIVKGYNIPILEVEGFEADDVIGTMAAKAAAEGFTTYMMTPDKDFGQLVGPQTLQYKPSYRGQDFELRGEKEVCERYGLQNTRQVIDLLALMGDKVDNIPGCPGVGEKTAVKLIGDFGSVDTLLERTDELKGALKRKIEENVEQIRFSKFLATIRTDVPLDVNPDDLVRRDMDAEKVMAIFKELEFKTLAERVKKRLSEEKGESAQPVAPSGQLSLFDLSADDAAPATAIAAGDYAVCTDLRALQDRVTERKRCGVFLLSEGENDVAARYLGAAVSCGEGYARYIPASDAAGTAYLLDLLAQRDVEKVTPQAKRDFVAARRLRGDEADPLCNYYDISLAHYLLQPEMRHGVEVLASTILGIEIMQESALVFPKGVKRGTFSALPVADLCEFACSRADASLRLYEPLSRAVKEEGMEAMLRDMELPLARVLAEMELAGVRIDVGALQGAAHTLEERLAVLEREIHELAGEEFNIGSPARVGEILFGKLQLDPKAKKTKSGQYSTSEDILEKLAAQHPIAAGIIEYRQLKKLLNTYLNALPETINPATGKIHTVYNQTVTATGRISSSNPNLQNIPIRDEVGREIRRAFIADPGDLFLSADYSQIELRLVADLAADETMLDAFRHGKDIHAITASKIYKEPLESVTADQRRAAKTANFGILYGISAFGLASRLQIPRADAKALIDGYFETFPAVHRYMSDSVERAREQGYVTTMMGRRRMLPDINSKNPVVRGYAERNAINAPIQGTAADIIKTAMVRITAEMRECGMKSRMIMQVHDELNFNVVPDEVAAMQELVTRCMEEAYKGRVTLTASCGVGPDWLTAH